GGSPPTPPGRRRGSRPPAPVAARRSRRGSSGVRRPGSAPCGAISDDGGGPLPPAPPVRTVPGDGRLPRIGREGPDPGRRAGAPVRGDRRGRSRLAAPAALPLRLPPPPRRRGDGRHDGTGPRGRPADLRPVRRREVRDRGAPRAGAGRRSRLRARPRGGTPRAPALGRRGPAARLHRDRPGEPLRLPVL